MANTSNGKHKNFPFSLSYEVRLYRYCRLLLSQVGIVMMRSIAYQSFHLTNINAFSPSTTTIIRFMYTCFTIRFALCAVKGFRFLHFLSFFASSVCFIWLYLDGNLFDCDCQSRACANIQKRFPLGLR